MELDELKSDWENSNNRPTNQNSLTSKMIDQMIQTKYNSKLNKIRYPEIGGGLVCAIAIVFIACNFNELDTAVTRCTGAIAILLLLLLPILSFLSLSKLNFESAVNESHVEVLQQFAIDRLRFQRYQKMNVTLCYLLMVAIIILLPKFFYGKDIVINKAFWTFAFSFGYIFLMVFSRLISRYYGRSLNRAEELLREIKETKANS